MNLSIIFGANDEMIEEELRSNNLPIDQENSTRNVIRLARFRANLNDLSPYEVLILNHSEFESTLFTFINQGHDHSVAFLMTLGAIGTLGQSSNNSRMITPSRSNGRFHNAELTPGNTRYEDAITYEPIDRTPIAIGGRAYSRETVARLLDQHRPTDPYTNVPLSHDEIHRLENEVGREAMTAVRDGHHRNQDNGRSLINDVSPYDSPPPINRQLFDETPERNYDEFVSPPPVRRRLFDETPGSGVTPPPLRRRLFEDSPDGDVDMSIDESQIPPRNTDFDTPSPVQRSGRRGTGRSSPQSPTDIYRTPDRPTRPSNSPPREISRSTVTVDPSLFRPPTYSSPSTYSTPPTSTYSTPPRGGRFRRRPDH